MGFAVDFVDGVEVSFVDEAAGGYCVPSGALFLRSCCELVLTWSRRVYANYMCQVWHDIFRVLEAPLADIESLNLSPYQFFRIERWIPAFEGDISEHNIAYIKFIWLLAISLHRQR